MADVIDPQSALRTMQHFAAQQDWDEDSQLMLALAYIEDNKGNTDFRDYLSQQADDENGLDEDAASD